MSGRGALKASLERTRAGANRPRFSPGQQNWLRLTGAARRPGHPLDLCGFIRGGGGASSASPSAEHLPGIPPPSYSYCSYSSATPPPSLEAAAAPTSPIGLRARARPGSAGAAGLAGSCSAVAALCGPAAMLGGSRAGLGRLRSCGGRLWRGRRRAAAMAGGGMGQRMVWVDLEVRGEGRGGGAGWGARATGGRADGAAPLPPLSAADDGPGRGEGPDPGDGLPHHRLRPQRPGRGEEKQQPGRAGPGLASPPGPCGLPGLARPAPGARSALASRGKLERITAGQRPLGPAAGGVVGGWPLAPAAWASAAPKRAPRAQTRVGGRGGCCSAPPSPELPLRTCPPSSCFPDSLNGGGLLCVAALPLETASARY